MASMFAQLAAASSAQRRNLQASQTDNVVPALPKVASRERDDARSNRSERAYIAGTRRSRDNRMPVTGNDEDDDEEEFDDDESLASDDSLNDFIEDDIEESESSDSDFDPQSEEAEDDDDDGEEQEEEDGLATERSLAEEDDEDIANYSGEEDFEDGEGKAKQKRERKKADNKQKNASDAKKQNAAGDSDVEIIDAPPDNGENRSSPTKRAGTGSRRKPPVEDTTPTIDPKNIVTGRRARRTVTRYEDAHFAERMLKDVPKNEYRYVEDSSETGESGGSLSSSDEAERRAINRVYGDVAEGYESSDLEVRTGHDDEDDEEDNAMEESLSRGMSGLPAAFSKSASNIPLAAPRGSSTSLWSAAAIDTAPRIRDTVPFSVYNVDDGREEDSLLNDTLPFIRTNKKQRRIIDDENEDDAYSASNAVPRKRQTSSPPRTFQGPTTTTAATTSTAPTPFSSKTTTPTETPVSLPPPPTRNVFADMLATMSRTRKT